MLNCDKMLYPKFESIWLLRLAGKYFLVQSKSCTKVDKKQFRFSELFPIFGFNLRSHIQTI